MIDDGELAAANIEPLEYPGISGKLLCDTEEDMHTAKRTTLCKLYLVIDFSSGH